MLDYAALKAADEALGIADPAAAAEALNAQTERLPPQLLDTRDVREPLLDTGLFVIWERYAESPVSSLSSPTQADQLVLLIQTWHRTLTLTNTIDLRDETAWKIHLGRAAIVVSAGLLTQGIVDAWTAMRQPVVPVWDPAPTEHDIAHARGL